MKVIFMKDENKSIWLHNCEDIYSRRNEIAYLAFQTEVNALKKANDLMAI